MVKQSGVFHMKTDQERELEKRVSDRKEEILETYRAQKEQRREAEASQLLKDTHTSHSRSGQSTSTVGAEERNGMEDRVGEKHVHGRLYSDHQSVSHCDREVTTDGGATSPPNQTSTCKSVL